MFFLSTSSRLMIISVLKIITASIKLTNIVGISLHTLKIIERTVSVIFDYHLLWLPKSSSTLSKWSIMMGCFYNSWLIYPCSRSVRFVCEINISTFRLYGLLSRSLLLRFSIWLDFLTINKHRIIAMYLAGAVIIVKTDKRCIWIYLNIPYWNYIVLQNNYVQYFQMSRHISICWLLVVRIRWYLPGFTWPIIS